MHNLYFVVFKSKEKFNPILEHLKNDMEKKEQRAYAFKKLSAKWFCDGDSGYGLADWFVIGGRWSGILSEVAGKQPQKDMDKFNEAIEEIRKQKKSKAEIEKDIAEAQKCVYRDTWNLLGYDDDSMIITKELLQGFKNPKGKDWLKDVEFVEYIGNKKEFRTIDELNENDIGKTIVVVDYHS